MHKIQQTAQVTCQALFREGIAKNQWTDIYRSFHNFCNDYVIVTCCHYGRISFLRERLAQAAVTSETNRPTDLKEAIFTEFVSSSY